MSFQTDVDAARTKLHSALRTATTQAATDAAYATFYKALVAAEEANPGNTAGGPINMAAQLDPTTLSRGHKG